MKQSTIKNVLFDLDGTLVDTAKDITIALNHLCEDAKQPLVSEKKIRPHIGDGSPSLLNVALKLSPDQANYNAIRQKFFDYYHQTKHAHSHLFAGIKNLLTTLDKHHTPWGIVTNKPTHLAVELIEHLNLPVAPQCIIGSDEQNPPKPHPYSVLKACEILNISPQKTVMIGDNPRDITAGNAAGCQSMAVRYGFVPLAPPIEEWQANFIVNSPIEIERILF